MLANDTSSNWGGFAQNLLTDFSRVAASNLSKQNDDAAAKNRPQEVADEKKTLWIIAAVAAGVVALVLLVKR